MNARDILEINPPEKDPYEVFAEKFVREHMLTGVDILQKFEGKTEEIDTYHLFFYKDLSLHYSVGYAERHEFDGYTKTLVSAFIEKNDFMYFLNTETKSIYIVNDPFKRGYDINDVMYCYSSHDNNMLAINFKFTYKPRFPKHSEPYTADYIIYFDIDTNMPVDCLNMIPHFDGKIERENISLLDVSVEKETEFTSIKYMNGNKLSKLNIYKNYECVFGAGKMRNFSNQYYTYIDDTKWAYKIFDMYPFKEPTNYSKKYETPENFKKTSMIYLKYLFSLRFKDEDFLPHYKNIVYVISSDDGCNHVCQEIKASEI